MRVLIFLLAALLCSLTIGKAAHAGRFCAGDRPSDFYGRDIQSEKSLALSDLEGKWVLVDFFATWCGPCMQDLPSLAETANKYRGERFELLMVSLDVEQTMDKLRPVLSEHDITSPVIFSGGGWDSPAVKEWGVQAIPDNYLISPQGVIVMQGLHGEDLDKALAKVLNFKGQITPICVATQGAMKEGKFDLSINFNNPLAAQSECKLETTFMVQKHVEGSLPEMDYQTSEQQLKLENPDGWETSTSLSLPLPEHTTMVYYKLSVYHPQLEMWVGFDGYVWPPKEQESGAFS